VAGSRSGDPACRAARKRVLRQLRDNLDGQPISIILTDANGLVLSRLTADADPRTPSRQGPARPGLQLRPRSSSANQRHRQRASKSGRPMHVFRTRALRPKDLEDLALRWRTDPPPRSPARRSARWDLTWLAQGCRPPARRAGPHDGRPDPAGDAHRDRDGGSSTCSRSTCEALPTQHRDRARAEQRPGHDERSGQTDPRVERPDGPARPGRRGAPPTAAVATSRSPCRPERVARMQCNPRPQRRPARRRRRPT